MGQRICLPEMWCTATEDLYAVGLRKEDKAFYDKLQAAMDKVIKDGKAGEISTKWFGENVVVK